MQHVSSRLYMYICFIQQLSEKKQEHLKIKKNIVLMCKFYYSLIMVFPRYLLFNLIVGKIFFGRIWRLFCPKMCFKNFENQLTIEKILTSTRK